MPTYKVAPKQTEPAKQVKSKELVRLERETKKLVPTIALEAETLVIVTEEEFANADAELKVLTQADKRIEAKFYGTKKEPGPIPKIRSGLDDLYALCREARKPIQDAIKVYVDRMGQYRLAERRLIEAAKAEQEAKADEIRRKAEALEVKAQTVKASAAAQRLMETADALLEQADEVEDDTPQAVIVSSTTRFKPAVRVNDMALLVQGIHEGLIPVDVIALVQSKLNQYLKDDEESVKAWAEYGVEVYDAAQIVRHS